MIYGYLFCVWAKINSKKHWYRHFLIEAIMNEVKQRRLEEVIGLLMFSWEWSGVFCLGNRNNFFWESNVWKLFWFLSFSQLALFGIVLLSSNLFVEWKRWEFGWYCKKRSVTFTKEDVHSLHFKIVFFHV